MNPDSENAQSEADADLRDIPKWARRYAQNRTLPVVAGIVMCAAASCVFAGLSLLTVWAYVVDKQVLAAASMLVLCGSLVWWVWYSFIGCARIIRGIGERLYQGDGGVTVAACAGTEDSKGPLLVGFVFMFCSFASIGLGLLGFLPMRFMQPISALYFVPFVCYVLLKARRVGSGFMFLWPGLYAIHAVLLVTGVPIGMGPIPDMALATFGYGLVATLAGHVYSRVALRRLRTLAASPESSDRE